MRVLDGTPSAPTLSGAGATEQRLIDGMNSSRDGEAVLTCPGEVKASVGFQRHPRPSRARTNSLYRCWETNGWAMRH